MPDVNDIVVANLTIADRVPAASNFGDIMLFAFHDNYVGAREYACTPAGLSAMAADGFALTSSAYLMQSAATRQNPGVALTKVFARTAENVQEYSLTPASVVVGFEYAFRVGIGADLTDVSYVVQSGDAVADVVTALQTSLDAISGVDAEDDVTHVTVTPTDAGTRVYLQGVPRQLTVLDESPNATIATDLASAAVDHDFYGFAIDSTSQAELEAAAAWALTNGKIFLGNTLDTIAEGPGSSDVGSVIAATGNHYAATLRSDDPVSYPHVGLMSRQFSRDPGSSNWYLKDVVGTVPDAWTAGEYANLSAKQYVTFNTISGLRASLGSRAASGRPLDVTRGTDWLKAIVQTEILILLANTEKVPFTPTGLSMVESAIRKAAARAERSGVLAEGWDVIMPVFADISTADKAARILAGIELNGPLQGAIESVNLGINLTL
jgi:hypothetical protein